MAQDWFTIDGSLDQIDFEGESHVRYPKELVKIILEKYSEPGSWVFDPFAGFGTTMHVAQSMNRNGIGFEIDSKRAEFARRGLKKPNEIVNDRVENLAKYNLPQFDLVLTSPPYVTVDLKDDPWGESYFQDMERIFQKIKNRLKSNSKIIVEVSNVSTEKGYRPLVWEFGKMLSQIFVLENEMTRCNLSGVDAGPGVQHSSVLVFRIQ